MAEALYGPAGFYSGGAPPAGHFRTSVHASPLFAGAVLALLCRVDATLGHPDPLDLVDVGAGQAELLRQLAAAAEPGIAARLRLTAVEHAPRPPGLPAAIAWAAEIPPLTGLLVANEWLDNVPLDVVEQTAAGPRLVQVTPTGAESLGDPPPATEAGWLARWWPSLRVGDRAEVGRPRDEAWGAAIRRVRRGVAVAVDYGHRRDGRPRDGTLTGYRSGHAVRPVPDGSGDLTAHVALDACAAAGQAAGATGTLLTTQRDALRQLGVHGRRPPIELASADPAGYLGALADAGAAGELTDPAGLGGFGWLVQAVDTALPLH
jgi:SAM-dependent MidA family methyltransferase